MLPLDGLKVIDFSQGVAGPYGAMLMGDFGADVVKIEPLGGDWSRTMGVRIGETESATYLAINRNKRSIAINLKDPRCLAVAKDLVSKADIVVQNYRPGVMARFGLDYATLSSTRPDLVYCSVSGFGSDGPWINYPSGDSTMQAWAGLMSIVGSADDEPTRVGNVVSDILSGMNVFQGALLAIFDRVRTGKGTEIEVSLMDSMIAFQTPPFAEYLATGCIPPRSGNHHPLVAPSGLFKTADSSVVFSVLQHQWQGFCEFFGVPEIATNPAFADNPSRLANRAALTAALQKLFASESTAEALRRLRACDVQCAPVNDYAGVAADPQVQLNAMLQMINHPQLGATPFVRNPVKLRGLDPAKVYAPLLGEHTDAVLRSAGCSDEAISAMRKDGSIR